MAGMARPVGAGATIEWNGKTYILDKFGLEDWGLIEHHLIRLKRKRKMQVIIDLREDLPPDVWNEKFSEARLEAEKIESVSPDELDSFAQTTDGVATMLFVLLDRRNPGEFRLEDMLQILGKQITPDQLSELIDARNQAAGIDPAGE